MTRDEMLAAAAAAHHAWIAEHADQVEAVPGHSRPHAGPGGPSDYAEHHADRSAPPELDDLLSSQLAGLIGQHTGTPPTPSPNAAALAGMNTTDLAALLTAHGTDKNAPVPTEESGRPVDDAGDVILEAGWVPPVPNTLLDLAEAGGDRKLRAYWVRGEGSAKIGWGKPGDFTSCVSHLGKYVTDPKGLCASYHKAATGEWPGKGRTH